jgi:hypothetical protein
MGRKLKSIATLNVNWKVDAHGVITSANTASLELLVVRGGLGSRDLRKHPSNTLTPPTARGGDLIRAGRTNFSSPFSFLLID